MSTLNLTLVQADLHWEDSNANTEMMEALLAELGPSDIIILPEMWNTGFSSKSKELAQTMDGPAVGSMKRWAQTADAVLVGSLMIEDKGNYYNRLLWVTPEGKTIVNLDLVLQDVDFLGSL